MQNRWIWQHSGWPNFEWEEGNLIPILRSIRIKQGVLIGKMSLLGVAEKKSHIAALQSENLRAILEIEEDQNHALTHKQAALILAKLKKIELPLAMSQLEQLHCTLFSEHAVEGVNDGTQAHLFAAPLYSIKNRP